MKKVLSWMLIAVMIICCVPAVAEETWQTAYKALLKNELPAGAQGYYVSYVDEDDIPELLVRCGDNEADAVLKVYTVSGGKAALAGEMSLAWGEPVHFGIDIWGIGVVTYHEGIESVNYGVFNEPGVLSEYLQYEMELQPGESTLEYDPLPMYAIDEELRGLDAVPVKDETDYNYYVFDDHYTIMTDRLKLAPGTVISDFSFTGSDGVQYSLSGLLQQYDAVLLNFFFIGCGWCEKQDVFMEKAYEAYKDRIAVVALSPCDSNDNIASFREQMGYTFIMAQDTAGLTDMFAVQGFPTSYMIGRDFAIGEEIKTVLDDGVFEGIFDSYLK